MICDHRITQIEKNNSLAEFSNDRKKNVLKSDEIEISKQINMDPKHDMFLGMMQIVTAHKW